MTTPITTLLDGGVPITSGADTSHDDDSKSTGNSSRSRPKAKTAAGKTRARKGAATVLSSSFTCWAKTPVPVDVNLAMLQLFQYSIV